jgi:hypothetical protein
MRKHIPVNGGAQHIRTETAEQYGIRPYDDIPADRHAEIVGHSLQLDREYNIAKEARR